MKVVRAYAISESLADATAKLNRSATFAEAINGVINDPAKLLEALKSRVMEGAKSSKRVKVSVTIEPSVAQKLRDLADHVDLGVEDVLRLALEAHLSH